MLGVSFGEVALVAIIAAVLFSPEDIATNIVRYAKKINDLKQKGNDFINDQLQSLELKDLDGEMAEIDSEMKKIQDKFKQNKLKIYNKNGDIIDE